MWEDFYFIIHKLNLFILCSIIVGSLVGIIFIDVHTLNDSVHEESIVEITQEIFLAIIVSLFFFHAYRNSLLRHSLILLGGFFTCMLIRELDFLFDAIRLGAWFWFACAVAIICFLITLRYPDATLTGLVEFLKHPSYGMMLAGLFCILVFSRLFGMQILWQSILSGGYQRVVKNIVEEGIELLGYTFCLFASVWYTSNLKNIIRKGD